MTTNEDLEKEKWRLRRIRQAEYMAYMEKHYPNLIPAILEKKKWNQEKRRLKRESNRVPKKRGVS